MRNALREKIADIIYGENTTYQDYCENLADAILALISTESLSQPSGIEAMRKCEACNGINPQLVNGEPRLCLMCVGKGEIVRELTDEEALKFLKDLVSDLTQNNIPYGFFNGERVRVKP